MYGKKPNVGDCHVFGGKAYAYVSVQKRKKLDEKSTMGIISNGYGLYDVNTKKIFASQDVIFYEMDTLDLDNICDPFADTNDTKSLDDVQGNANMHVQEKQQEPTHVKATRSEKTMPKWVVKLFKMENKVTRREQKNLDMDSKKEESDCVVDYTFLDIKEAMDLCPMIKLVCVAIGKRL